MDERIIAAISLSNRDFPSFESKLREAVDWIDLAARAGARLAVLPEAINVYCGDGPGNPLRKPHAEYAVDDWRSECGMLVDAAKRLKITLTIPIIRRLGDGLTNCFLLISKDGELLGEYQKRCPTPPELASKVAPGRTAPIPWEGIKIGGGICFDTLFPEVFADQAAAGADLFIVPSLWPGGGHLDYYALEYSCPVVLAYPAWSRLLDSDGFELGSGGHRWETLRFGFGSPVVMATINFDSAVFYGNDNQLKMVEIQRALGKKIRIRFNQTNVTFHLESRSPDLSIKQVIEQFGLVTRREYFHRCRQQIGTIIRSEND